MAYAWRNVSVDSALLVVRTVVFCAVFPPLCFRRCSHAMEFRLAVIGLRVAGLARGRMACITGFMAQWPLPAGAVQVVAGGGL